MNKKVEFSNRIYPYFYGISSDLLFFIAIDTIFLAIVKGYSAAQINFLTAFSMISVLILQPINLKIIKKIGNIKSIKLGMWILLIGALLITFSNNYFITLIGYGLYEIAYIFKSMESVVLKRNLIFLGNPDDFVKIQSKGATVYSIITLVISLIAGYLFTINHYLPMYLCISFCILNIILCNFLYEANIEKDTQQKESKFKFTNIIILIILVYSIGYSMMSLAQNNSKLFMQVNMLSILDVQKTSIYLVIIIAISRVVRVVSNLIFPKVYRKLKDKILYLTIILFIVAHILVLLGNFLCSNIIGIYVMCIGYFIYLAIRDPYQTYIKEIFLNNVDTNSQEKAITILALAKNIQKLIFSSIITLILFKFDLRIVFIMFLILSLIEFIISIKLYKIVGGNKNGKNE